MAGCPQRIPDPSAPPARERVLGRALSWGRRSGGGSDLGSVVVGWFARIVITVALVGMVAFDGISIAIARAHVNDIASDSADAAATQYALHPNNVHGALAAAIAKAGTEGGSMTPDGLVVTRSGRVTTLRITVHLVPSTVLLGHVPGTGSLTQNSAVAVRTVQQ